MDEKQRQLLRNLATALEKAGEAARLLAEYQPKPVTLELSEENDLKWIYKANRDNPEASDKLPAD